MQVPEVETTRMTNQEQFLHAFDRLPDGAFNAYFNARRYLVVKTGFGARKAQKLVAQELGGQDYISLNLYRLKKGALLKPCEMPESKVIEFVLGLEVVLEK